MKRLYYCLMMLTALVAAASCKGDDPAGPTPTPDPVQEPSLTVSKASIAVDAKGSTVTIYVEANNNWAVALKQPASWVSINPGKGTADDVSFDVTIAENTASDPRTAAIVVACEDLVKEISVSQEGAKADSGTDPGTDSGTDPGTDPVPGSDKDFDATVGDYEIEIF